MPGILGDFIDDVEAFFDRGKEKIEHETDFWENYSHPSFDAAEASSKNWVKKEAQSSNERLDDMEQKIKDDWDQAHSNVGDILNNVTVKMPAIDLSALNPLSLLPDVFITLTDVIKNMFTFDLQDYYETAAKLKEISTQIKE